VIKDLQFPTSMYGAALDDYLAKGWYRIGQVIFTTDYIPHPDGWYRVFWLRYDLEKFRFGKKQSSLLKKNSEFTVDTSIFQVNKEMEELYGDYYLTLNFSASPTIQNFLFDYGIVDEPQHNIYDSWKIEARHANKLVAVGIFDKGENAMAGILNYYDPAYKKYSLGKWLMLLKIRQAIDSGMKYYYPGYIAYEYSKFDYKLWPGMEYAQVYDPFSRDWIPYEKSLLENLAGIG
jgi:leucyl-tRNA---protein transferase